MRLFPWIFACAAVALGVASCSDFKTSGDDHASGEGDGGGSAPGPGISADGGAKSPSTPTGTLDGSSNGDVAPGHGPGVRGALPSGFCCNFDEECRERHCLDYGNGVKACADECSSSGFCNTKVVSLQCAVPDGGIAGYPNRGYCKLTNPTSCVPQGNFKTGTRVLGNCCGWTPGVEMGWECEGALCTATGDGPWICTHYCESTLDCSGPYTCEQIGGYKMCVPGNGNYTCN
jgi:hypothetical protein